MLICHKQSYCTDEPEEIYLLGAVMYPEDQSYRRGPIGFYPGTFLHIDLGVEIEGERYQTRLDPHLAGSGVVLTGTYHNGNDTLRAVIYNPTAHNLTIDNGTPILRIWW